MGSLGGQVAGKAKAAFMYQKQAMGANPSERWGHSACFFNGLLYIFGGCHGGVHFSDVLVCSLETMTWNILKTSGQGPGPRDSHSAVLVRSKMIVFGGTNGSKKVNDLHILDLLSKEWTCPEFHGNPPCARESHTSSVVSDEKMVVFGGSGEGDVTYLNDIHILDLKTMEWTSPEVGGRIPAPRDSHSSVAVGNKLFVFGGDSGDRYQCDVCVLDMETMIWSTLDGSGPVPGARAGHASVSMGNMVYVLGGVRDKQYFKDVWVLDSVTSSWHQLDTCLQKSQGRFSHTATVTDLGVAIFGGCGEDERPLRELLILYFDSLETTSFKSLSDEETKKFIRKSRHDLQGTTFESEGEGCSAKDVQELKLIPERSFRSSSDMLHPKRRRTSNSEQLEMKPKSQEHPLSLSQHMYPSQSDNEKMMTKSNFSCSSSRVHPLFRQKISIPNVYQPNHIAVNSINHAFTRTSRDIHLPSERRKREMVNSVCNDACRERCRTAESSSEAGKARNLIGAEVRGQVDGAFDSGYLMTAVVDGTVFRGVLFPPGPDFMSRSVLLSQHTNRGSDARPISCKVHPSFCYPMHYPQPERVVDPATSSRRSTPEKQTSSPPLGKHVRAELHGEFLTLGGPGSDHSGS